MAKNLGRPRNVGRPKKANQKRQIPRKVQPTGTKKSGRSLKGVRRADKVVKAWKDESILR